MVYKDVHCVPERDKDLDDAGRPQTGGQDQLVAVAVVVVECLLEDGLTAEWLLRFQKEDVGPVDAGLREELDRLHHICDLKHERYNLSSFCFLLHPADNSVSSSKMKSLGMLRVVVILITFLIWNGCD